MDASALQFPVLLALYTVITTGIDSPCSSLQESIIPNGTQGVPCPALTQEELPPPVELFTVGNDDAVRLKDISDCLTSGLDLS